MTATRLLIEGWVRKAFWVGNFLAITALFIFGVPGLIGWWHLTAVGRILSSEGEFTLQERSAEARSHVLAAQRWLPNQPLVYRYLARIDQALDQPDQAIAALETALRLSPESLLIREELALAYSRNGESERAEQIWLELGLTPERMSSAADGFLRSGDAQTAFEWYQVAEQRAAQWPVEFRFRQVLAMARANISDPDLTAQGLEDEVLFDATTGVHFPGGALRWWTVVPEYAVLIGTPLNFARPGDSGVMYWIGEAIGLVKVDVGGAYAVTAQLRHGLPPPILMRIGVNNVVMQQLNLDRGDDAVSAYTFQVDLPPGVHSLHFWFDNNAIVDGNDRDAEVLEVSVQPIAADR